MRTCYTSAIDSWLVIVVGIDCLARDGARHRAAAVGLVGHPLHAVTDAPRAALSIDRLEITHGRYGNFMISPREREHFVEELSRLRAQQQRGLGLER